MFFAYYERACNAQLIMRVSINIVKPTRAIGNAKLYKLNLENNFVKKMIDLFDTLVIEPLNKKKMVVIKH